MKGIAPASDGTGNFPVLQRLAAHLSVRQILLSGLMLTSLIVVLLALGHAYHSWRHYQSSAWNRQAAGVNDAVATLISRLGLERGLTGLLLADDGHEGTPERLVRYRAAVDRALQQVSAATSGLSPADGAGGVVSAKEHFTVARRRFVELRAEVDDHRAGSADAMGREEWFETSTALVQRAQELGAAVSKPLPENEQLLRDETLLKRRLFRVIENLGQARVLLGMAIRGRQQLDAKERAHLDRLDSTAAEALKNLGKRLEPYRQNPAIDDAYNQLVKRYQRNFQPLRDSIMTATEGSAGYPIGAFDWFDQATLTIDAAIWLSEVIGREMGRRAAVLQRQALRRVLVTMGIAVATVLLALAGFVITFRRIITPIRSLRQAAETIQRGDLATPVSRLPPDEFGQLARTFDSMRSSLLADIEERERAAEELRKLSRAVEQSENAIIILDAEGHTEYVNPCFTRFTGYTAQEVLGERPDCLRADHLPAMTYERLRDALSGGYHWQGEIAIPTKDGRKAWNWVTLSPVRDQVGAVKHFICIRQDVSERKEMEERLYSLAYYDELTGLPNRHYLEEAFSEVARGATGMALFAIDLDHFGHINHVLSHRSGDRLLQEVAGRLVGMADTGDTVIRFGDDEFMVLREAGESDLVIEKAAKEFLANIAEPLWLDGQQLRITCSIGTALFPRDGVSLEALFSAASAATNQAKTLGRATHASYSQDLRHELGERHRLETALHGAIEAGQLYLHYQPQVDVRKGIVCGAEALLRWEHPELGNVSPVRFIPVAEETGLIVPIGEWVLRTACTQWRRWLDKGFPPTTLSVNLSVRQLAQADLVDRIAGILEETGMQPAFLELEVTESAVMEDPEAMTGRLARLKELGLRLAIDDFGTGHSSLAYLRRFRFDRIKVDRSFVKEITTDTDQATICRTIVSMGRNLQQEVIAEGVEHDEQGVYLFRYGCEQIQGFLFSRPVTSAQFEALLDNGRRFRLSYDVEGEGQPTVLLVDDEVNVARALQRSLRNEGYRILVATTVEEAYELMVAHDVDVVLTDQRMSPISGIELLERIKALYPDTIRMVLSGHTDLDTVTEAVNRGEIFKFLSKPWEEEALRSAVAEAFRARAARSGAP